MARNVDALQRFLERRAFMPHAWGRRKNDCIAFIAGAVAAQTRHSPVGKLTWSGKAGALRVLKREGGMQKAIDRRFERIAPALAMRGDIAGVPSDLLTDIPADERALIALHPFIVEGAMLVAPGPHGLFRVPRALATVAWNIEARKALK